MPLVRPTLEAALAVAFEKAMLVFKETIENAPGLDVGEQARKAAGITFSRLAGPAIDLYIKSATIVVPPGQAVATAGTPAAQAGATTSPSPPALIT
jgi:hypothetical protein